MKRLVLCLASLLLFSHCSKNNKTVQVAEQPLTEAVYASGSIAAQDEYQVFSLAEGTVVERLANEGDIVAPGQTLYRIESDEQALRTLNTAELLATARNNLSANSPIFAEIRAQIAGIRARIANDSTNFARITELRSQNISTQAELDRTRTLYENSKQELAAAQERLRRTRTQLETELANAETNAKLMNVQQGRYEVKTLKGGRALSMLREKGEAVRRGEAVALLGDPATLFLKLSVDELDVQKVKIGQEILVKIDAYKDRVFKAEVAKVYPMFNRKEQAFRVDARLTDPLPAEFTGLTVEANIIIRQETAALIVPKSAVLPGDTVRLMEDGKMRKVKIEKGVSNFDVVEVKKGLTKGQTVAVD